MVLELESNEAQYILQLLRKDAKERGRTDVANWVLRLSTKFEKVGA